MAQNIAVALIHGIGTQKKDFSDQVARDVEERCREKCGGDMVVGPVYWAGLMQKREDELWDKLISSGPLDWRRLRQFLVNFLADAFAYQPTEHDRTVYDDLHAEFARTLRKLAERAGGEAPLCIIAHSLGSVITSNFIYDLQKPQLIAERVKAEMRDTPLDLGKTLTLLYTLGSPLALWGLRFEKFGQPIKVPAPELVNLYPRLEGKWINYYDRDDAFAFPLRRLNDAYETVVKEDKEVNVGNFLTSWNPLSHLDYWTDSHVLGPISTDIMEVWETVNHPAL